MNSDTLQHILQIAQTATVLAGLVAPLTGGVAPSIEADVKIAAALEAIILNALAAHQAALGEPMDLSKLHPIDPTN